MVGGIVWRWFQDPVWAWKQEASFCNPPAPSPRGSDDNHLICHEVPFPANLPLCMKTVQQIIVLSVSGKRLNEKEHRSTYELLTYWKLCGSFLLYISVWMIASLNVCLNVNHITFTKKQLSRSSDNVCFPVWTLLFRIQTCRNHNHFRPPRS